MRHRRARERDVATISADGEALAGVNMEMIRRCVDHPAPRTSGQRGARRAERAARSHPCLRLARRTNDLACSSTYLHVRSASSPRPQNDEVIARLYVAVTRACQAPAPRFHYAHTYRPGAAYRLLAVGPHSVKLIVQVISISCGTSAPTASPRGGSHRRRGDFERIWTPAPVRPWPCLLHHKKIHVRSGDPRVVGSRVGETTPAIPENGGIWDAGVG